MQKLRFHHVGIPTNRTLPKEGHSSKLKMTGYGYFDSPYAIEWMNFDPDNELPELIKTVPHVAYVVDNLDEALKDKEVIDPPSSPADGVRVAFIVDNGVPIEFLEFEKPEEEVWPHPGKFEI